MKYQAIKHLKTTTKLLGLFDTLEDARTSIEAQGARFEGLSYVGQFPTFRLPATGTMTRSITYSIQGLVISPNWPAGVVCSIPQREVESLGA